MRFLRGLRAVLCLGVLFFLSACAPEVLEPGATEEATTESETPTPTAQPASPGPEEAAYPGPQPTSTDAPPLPTRTPRPTLIPVGTNVYAEPTETAAPLPTPLPSPTRRPGPTATAMPVVTPPADPSGVIHFAAFGEIGALDTYTPFDVRVDERGSKVGTATPNEVPITHDWEPFKVHRSPTGKYMVLMRPAEPGGQPFVYNVEANQLNAVTAEQLFGDYPREIVPGGQFFGWHPDGKQFLFSDLLGPMWLIDAETLQATTLVFPEAQVNGAAISPDGQSIAYIDRHSPETLGALWVVSSAGSDAEPRLDVGGGASLSREAWSPEGSKLIYHCGGDQPENAICLYEFSGAEPRVIELPFYRDRSDAPRWSPDGGSVLMTAFTEEESSCDRERAEAEPAICNIVGRSIYRLAVETGETTFLAHGRSPVWSPDGSLVAYISLASGTPQIWLMSADGSELRQLTDIGLVVSPYDELHWCAL